MTLSGTAAHDEERGSELWCTDGTGAGTTLVMDINPGPDTGVYARNVYFGVYNDKVYFQGNPGYGVKTLWSSDGSSLGTSTVANGSYLHPDHWIAYNGKFCFNAQDHPDAVIKVGREMYCLATRTPPSTNLIAILLGSILGALALACFLGVCCLLLKRKRKNTDPRSVVAA